MLPAEDLNNGLLVLDPDILGGDGRMQEHGITGADRLSVAVAELLPLDVRIKSGFNFGMAEIDPQADAVADLQKLDGLVRHVCLDFFPGDRTFLTFLGCFPVDLVVEKHLGSFFLDAQHPAGRIFFDGRLEILHQISMEVEIEAVIHGAHVAERIGSENDHSDVHGLEDIVLGDRVRVWSGYSVDYNFLRINSSESRNPIEFRHSSDRDHISLDPIRRLGYVLNILSVGIQGHILFYGPDESLAVSPGEDHILAESDYALFGLFQFPDQVFFGSVLIKFDCCITHDVLLWVWVYAKDTGLSCELIPRLSFCCRNCPNPGR